MSQPATTATPSGAPSPAVGAAPTGSSSPTVGAAARRRSSSPAAVAAGLSLALIALQYLIDRPTEDALRELLVVIGMIVVAVAIVFGLIVPRVRAKGGSAPVALTLSLLGLLLAAAYWSGIPPVLAIGGIVLGRDAGGTMGRVAAGVGALAVVADVAVLLVGAIA